MFCVSDAAAQISSAWYSQDVGAVGTAGNATFNSANGVYTVAGAGADIWDAADAFRYVNKTLTGDGEIIARITSQQNTNRWAKAGLMFRENMNEGSRHVSLLMTPSGGILFSHRAAESGNSTTVLNPPGSVPLWLKLSRVGNNFYAFRSDNGSNWTLMAQDTMALTNNVYVGLAVSSLNPGKTSTATFDNLTARLKIDSQPPTVPGNPTVSNKTDTYVDLQWTASSDDYVVTGYEIYRAGVKVGTSVSNRFTDTGLSPQTAYSYTVRAVDSSGQLSAASAVLNVTTAAAWLAAPWGHRDLGTANNVNIGGTAVLDAASGVFRVSGAGKDFWGVEDSGHFAYRTMTGDGWIIARLNSQSANDPWAKAGLQLRETLNANSKHTSVFLTPGNGLNFMRRASTGGGSTSTSLGAAAGPIWLKVGRVGATFSAYKSADGINWTFLGSQNMTVTSTIYAGLAVTSHLNTALSLTAFDNVSVVPAVADAQPPTTPTNLTTLAASDVSLTMRWTASTDDVGVSYYQVFRGGALCGVTNSNSYTDTNLAPNTTYSYTVQAVDGSGKLSAITAARLSTTRTTMLPAPWKHEDMGNVGAAGLPTLSGSSLSIDASGQDIWYESDSGHFVYQPLYGDGSIVTRVTSVEQVDLWSKAGIEIRSSLGAGAAHAMLVITPGNGVSFQRRLVDGDGSVAATDPGPVAPYWLKLTRQGSVISAFRSESGVNWTLVGTETIAMPTNAYIGFVVTAKDNNAYCTATFDSIAITSAPNQAPTVSLTAPLSGANYAPPASLVLRASAADADGAVTKVEFYYGDNIKIGESTVAPYQFTWAGVPAGAYTLKAKATDNLGAIGASNTVTVNVSNNVLPDDWQIAHFGHTGIDSSSDPDGDGRTNLQEYQDGTDPLDPGSYAAGQPLTPGNAATFVSQQVPTTMLAGQVYPVSVTLHNVGTTTWTPSDQGSAYKLGSQNPQDNAAWGISRVLASDTVKPWSTRTYQFSVAAPDALGTYNFQWRTLQEGVEWFGDFTPNVAVQVVTSTAPAAPGGLTYTVVPNVGLRLNWTDRSADETGFSIQRKSAEAPAWQPVGSVAANLTTFTDTGATIGHPYFYRVLANNDVGSSHSDPIFTGAGPLVSIISPVVGQQTTAHGRFILTALALDSGASVTKVEFFEGAAKLGEAVAQPFSIAWENVSAGAHTITAVATDSLGAVAASDPVTVSAISFPGIAAGGYQSFAMQANGALWAWGDNSVGQLGLDANVSSYPEPAKVGAVSGVLSVATGKRHTLILNADHTVSACGSNEKGQLGLNNNNEDKSTPSLVPGISNVSAVAAGTSLSVALRNDGTVWSWGGGQPVPAALASPAGISAIAVGDDHVLALATDHTVWAWGGNDNGQLGVGSTSSQTIPVHVAGLQNVMAVAAGKAYSVALTSDGTVYTWGDNSRGQLGNGGHSPSYTPLAVGGGLPTAAAIATKGTHTLVLTMNGQVWAFGSNDKGQTGASSNVDQLSPLHVDGLPSIVQIAAGTSHSMALTADGQILTWGDDSNAQLGRSDVVANSASVPGGIHSLSANDNGTSSGTTNGSGGQGKPNPGGGGAGPALDADHNDNQLKSASPALTAKSYKYMDASGAEVEEDTTAELKWTESSKEKESTVQIQRRDGREDWKLVGQVNNGDATSYRDSDGLLACVGYQYRLLVRYTNGRMLYSNSASFSVPLVRRLLAKQNSYSRTKSGCSFVQFSKFAVLPKYYLKFETYYEDTTSTHWNDGPDGDNGSTYNKLTYWWQIDPKNHYWEYHKETTYEGDEDDIGLVEYDYHKDDYTIQLRNKSSKTQEIDAVESVNYTDPGDTPMKSHFHEKITFDAPTGGALWSVAEGLQAEDVGMSRVWLGEDYIPKLGKHTLNNYVYEGKYTRYDNYQEGSDPDETSIEDASGNWDSGENYAPIYEKHWGYSPFNWNYPFSYPTAVGNPTTRTWPNGAIDTLSVEYTTENFLKDFLSDLPDYPAEYSDLYVWHNGGRFEFSADSGRGAGKSKDYKIASRSLNEYEDSVSVEKSLYKLELNPSKPAPFRFYDIFVPDADAQDPEERRTIQVVGSHTITGSESGRVVSDPYEVNPATMPDKLQVGCEWGVYYVVPGSQLLVAATIKDPTSANKTNLVDALDASEKANGDAILSPKDPNGNAPVTGSFSISNPYQDSEWGNTNLGQNVALEAAYEVTWTNQTDFVLKDPKGNIVEDESNPHTSTGKKTFTAEELAAFTHTSFSVTAKASAYETETLELTLVLKLNDVLVNQDKVVFTVKINSPSQSFTIPFGEASGARYRKIALNGRPMPDEKPQHTAESDQSKEQTYVDALTLGLHHGTTDIYVPISGSDLVLSVRRDTLSEVWNMRNGMRPHERYNRPFGAGWSSNLTPNIEVDRSIAIPTYNITDQNGAVHRYVQINGKFVPLPSDQRENGDYLTSFDGSIFTDRFGTRIRFETAPSFYRKVAGDHNAGSHNLPNAYTRVQSIADRQGNVLLYTYPANAITLIPSMIALQAQPELAIYIRQDSVGHITDIWDPNYNHYRYNYEQTDDYFYNAEDFHETLLTSVSAPIDSPVAYTYTGVVREIDDQTPAIVNQGKPTDKLHLDIASITDGRGKKTTITYIADWSKFDFNPQTNTYFRETGAPFNVLSITLPGIARPTAFLNQSTVKLSYDETGLLSLGASVRKNKVTDAEGHATTYSFNKGQVFNTQGIASGSTPIWATPKVAFYPEMQVEYSNVGSETFTFEPAAGLALSKVVDLSSNITTFTYINDSPTQALHHTVFPNFNFFALYSDPNSQHRLDSQSQPAVPVKEFTYSSNWHLLSQIKDEQGRTTDYTFDILGRRTKETISGDAGVVQSTTFDYASSTFPGFVTKRTVQKLNLPGKDPTWGGNLVTNYEPDNFGRVAQQIVDPTGLHLATSYEYDANGNKLSETDPRLHTTYFTYDKRNRLTDVLYADGAHKGISYDENGNKTQEEDENRHATLFEYDDANRLKRQARDMDGNGLIDPGVDLITSYTYNNVNSPLTIIDPNGNKTTHHYDELQRVVQTDHPLIPSTTYAYGTNSGGSAFDSSSFKPTQVTDPAGYATSVVYDAVYRPCLTSRQYQRNPARYAPTLSEYDGVGNVRFSRVGYHVGETDPAASEADPASSDTGAYYSYHTTETTYDALNRPTQVGYPDGRSVCFVYSSTGLKWQSLDERQKLTETRYDGAGRPTDVLAPAVDDGTGQMKQPRTQTHYDANGNAQSSVDARQYVTERFFDVRNRLSDEWQPAVFDAASGLLRQPHTHTDYDDAGNRLAVTDARGFVTNYYPDAANRVWQVLAPAVPLDGNPAATTQPGTQTVYDLNGNARSVTDARGRVTQNFFDALNRLSLTVDAENAAVAYGYDALGNRTEVRAGQRFTGLDAQGAPQLAAGEHPQITRLTFDGLKRLTSSAYPTGTTRFTFDALKQLGRVDANGEATRYDGYDARERLKHVSYPQRPADNRSFDYDETGRLLSVVESGHGGATDVACTYDDLGRLTSESSGGLVHLYGYDLAGNRVRAQYGGSGRVLISRYDPLNRLSALGDGANGATSYQYDLGGHVLCKQFASGEAERASFDALGRQSASSDVGAGGLLYAYAYGYDALGNLTRMAESKAGLAPRCTRLDYFDNDRLKTERVYAGLSESAPLSKTTAYAYDETGNRKSRTVTEGAAAPLTTTYAYNADNQLTGWNVPAVSGGSPARSVTFGYDLNGNRTSRQEAGAASSDGYSYDAENRLTGLDKAGVHYAYLYDYRTRRVSRQEGASSPATRVVYSGGSSVAEYEGGSAAATNPDGSPAPTVEYIRGSDWGGGVGGILYSVRAGSRSYAHYDSRGDVATRTDAGGAITYQAAYEAWGTRAAEYGGSPDRQRANTKEEDPTGLLNEGQRYRDLETGGFITRDPAGFVDGPNLYAYVQQNPWSKFDPVGLLSSSSTVSVTNKVAEAAKAAKQVEYVNPIYALLLWFVDQSGPGHGSLVLPPGSVPIGEFKNRDITYSDAAYGHPTNAGPQHGVAIPAGADEADKQQYFRERANGGESVAQANLNNAVAAKQSGSPGGKSAREIDSPIDTIRDNVQGSYIDPMTNLLVKTTDRLAADHIIPYNYIEQMSGYNQLTDEQKEAVQNNPQNFQGLPKSFNSSKQHKLPTEWLMYKNQPLHPEYIKRNQTIQETLIPILQQQIDNFSKSNENNE